MKKKKPKLVSENAIRNIITRNFKEKGITKEVADQLLPFAMRPYDGKQSDKVISSQQFTGREILVKNNRRIRKETAPLSKKMIKWIEEGNSRQGKPFKVISESTMKYPPMKARKLR